MPARHIDVPGVGSVAFTKRASSRSIRLSLTQSGVRVSLPPWVAYRTAVKFVAQQADWIQAKLPQAQVETLLENGSKIGKQHTIVFETVALGSSTSSRVTSTRVLIRVHPRESITSSLVQLRATTAAKRALKKEALQLLPDRVAYFAAAHNMTYSTIQAKELKRRWGSCDSHKNLIFNIYLLQLPWSQIDYVIAHELTHTEQMNHGPDFWARLEELLPYARSTAKLVRHTQPALTPRQSATALDDDMAY